MIIIEFDGCTALCIPSGHLQSAGRTAKLSSKKSELHPAGETARQVRGGGRMELQRGPKYGDLESQEQQEGLTEGTGRKEGGEHMKVLSEGNFFVESKRAGWRSPSMGDLANLTTFLVMITGVLLHHYVQGVLSRLVLAFGLFGFAGGITNWLAVKMLFDKIPFLLGSGVIPRQFKEIRRAIKEAVMQMFFDKKYLESYLGPRSRELLKSMDLPQILKETMEAPDFDQILVEKLTSIANKPEGMMLQTMASMFGGVELMAPTLKPMLLSFGQEMVSTLVDKFDPQKVLSIEKIQHELDILMEEKLLQLTPNRVKEIMEGVIRNHLGWLVIWGNVFGGFIGIISLLAGYGG